MTIGLLFTDLVQILEIGTCAPSPDGQRLTITPHYAEELLVSNTKRLLTQGVQLAFAQLAHHQLTWEVAIGPEQQALIDEVVMKSLYRITGFSPGEMDEASQELFDALSSCRGLAARRIHPHP